MPTVHSTAAARYSKSSRRAATSPSARRNEPARFRDRPRSTKMTNRISSKMQIAVAAFAAMAFTGTVAAQATPAAPTAPAVSAAPVVATTPAVRVRVRPVQAVAIAPRAEAGDPWTVMQDGRSYMGVDIADVNADRVKELKLKDEHGVEVTAVDQDAPAGKAGVKEHDVILEFNGQRVESEEQLRRMIRETPPGRVVTLGVSRDGQ